MDDDKLQLAREVLKVFGSLATSAGVSRATEVNAAISAMRPYLQCAFNGRLTKTLRDENDLRTLTWHASMQWHNVRTGELVRKSEGMELDSNNEVIRYGLTAVDGLNGVAKLIAADAVLVEAPVEEYDEAAMERALANLRPTISRQGGKATMRRPSLASDLHLVCFIFRDDALPIERGVRLKVRG